MKKPSAIFYWGMLISFIGSLPPGLINIAALQIYDKQGAGAAMIYAIGSMLAEIVIVRLALSGMSWLTRSQRFFYVLEWMTAAMLIAFSIACFLAANSTRDIISFLPELLWPPFISGILLSAFNPLHIPFWMGWSTVLMNKGTLTPQSYQYNWYVAGIALGTMVGFIVFIFGGQYLASAFETNHILVNLLLGFVLLVTAFFHIRKMIFVPVSVRHARLLDLNIIDSNE